MSYHWEASFNAVSAKGVPRIVEMIKLALKEVPRLHKEFLTNDMQRYMTAKQEVVALFARLDEELVKARDDAGMTEAEFNAALTKREFFTLEEQQALSSMPERLKGYGINLMGPTPPKPPADKKKRKKNPRFKV